MAAPRHIIESQQFDPAFLGELFACAEDLLREGRRNAIPGMTLATLFYEPSTRTRLSFEAAMNRLGGNVVTTRSAWSPAMWT
jgi:aspartate carbamoyltransferase catalytic subunit